jgi:hypothetical protein
LPGLFLFGISACDHNRNSGSTDRSSDHESVQDNHKSSKKYLVERSESPERPMDADPFLNPSTGSTVPLYRPEDRRTRHDEKRLADVGIRLFESKRLRLYTDVKAESVQMLPSLVDELYVAWEGYFGAMPPDRAGTDFQMSGYLMRDMSRFRGLGLIPEELTFEHGSHLQNEFWMRDQEFDYYRRHLLFHEATHCFMTLMPGVDAPRWYLEGMAEYFGAHRVTDAVDKDGLTRIADSSAKATQFCVMPTSPQEFTGFGRISIIRKDLAENQFRRIPSVMGLNSSEFVTPKPYAWSWALCAFLDGTPNYHERFQKLSRFTQGNQFSREFARTFDSDERDLATEWALFLTNLQYGYNLKNAAIDFRMGELLTNENAHRTVEIDANRGWQSSGVFLQLGAQYEITAEGRFTLAEGNPVTKPWVSEPQGISFQYFDGQPLGTLLGCIRAEEGTAGGEDDPMLKVIVFGRRHSFKSPVSGTLYLRLNDAWSSLVDNRGKSMVTIRRLPEPVP